MNECNEWQTSQIGRTFFNKKKTKVIYKSDSRIILRLSVQEVFVTPMLHVYANLLKNAYSTVGLVPDSIFWNTETYRIRIIMLDDDCKF